MNCASGVFFQVGATNANAPAAAVVQLDIEPAVLALGKLKLANLVALGQIGIGVVLACENGDLWDGAVQRQAGLDRRFYCRPVDDRQGTGQTQADRTNPRIGRRAGVICRTAAEHF